MSGRCVGQPTSANLLAEVGPLRDLPVPLLPWLPHLQAVTDQAVVQGETVETAHLCNQCGYALDTIADYARARPYYERALAILEARLGPDHPNTKIVQDNLATLDQ